eukprot:428274_1
MATDDFDEPDDICDDICDNKSLSLRYIKFTHGCLIFDCVEQELRSYAKVSDLLCIYGLYKQVMCGDNNTAQPSYIYAESRLKWNAWSKYHGLTKKEALIEWEILYNKFRTSFPVIFGDYPHSDLSSYDPVQMLLDHQQHDRMRKLQFDRDIDDAKQDSDRNGISYVSLKQQQYQDIIKYVNELKNKMKKYHIEFDANVQQIKTLKNTINNDRSMHKRYRRKSYFMVIFVIIAIILAYIYRKRKG